MHVSTLKCKHLTEERLHFPGQGCRRSPHRGVAGCCRPERVKAKREREMNAISLQPQERVPVCPIQVPRERLSCPHTSYTLVKCLYFSWRGCVNSCTCSRREQGCGFTKPHREICTAEYIMKEGRKEAYLNVVVAEDDRRVDAREELAARKEGRRGELEEEQRG